VTFEESRILETATKESTVYYYVLINGAIAVIVFFTLAVFDGFLRQRLQYPDWSKSDTCKSANCVRCRSAYLQRDILLDKLHEFIAKSNTKPEALERLFESLLNGDRASDCVRQRPTTLGLIGLTSQPWHSAYSSELKQLLTFKKLGEIKEEVSKISQDLSRGWVKNTCPTGCWYVYHLYNQGEMVQWNCRECPRTAELVECICPFMKGCAFGNAVISLVQPGTHITPHHGPTNCRLRCHIPLQIPEGCKIIVDQEERQWQDGQTLLFDDSYLHEVRHAGRKGNRIVLILDLWHPEVMAVEKRAINFVFSNLKWSS